MMNNTTAIANSFDLTALTELLKNANAIIILNNGNGIEVGNIIDSTATEVPVKHHAFNYHKFYTNRVHSILNDHDIKVKNTRGVKKGYISMSAFNTFVKQLENNQVSLKRIKFLFDALDEAGYKEEGRGLRNDILFEVLDYIKEKNLAKHNNYCYRKGQTQHELDNLVDTLIKIPLTNDFRRKFSNCLKANEAEYTTFELVDAV